MSVYKGLPCTKKGITIAVHMAKTAFKALPEDFFELMIQLAIEEGMSDQRLLDSVKHVIKTCPYPEPTIANFFNYDKTVKLYTYEQYLDLNHKMANKAGKLYHAVQIKGHSKPMWAHVNDIKEYNLQAVKKK